MTTDLEKEREKCRLCLGIGKSGIPGARCPACGGSGMARWADARAALAAPAAHPNGATIADYEEVLADHRRLVRELDVLLNGKEGAAPQASLVDIVAQVRKDGIKAARAAPQEQPSDEEIIDMAVEPLGIDCDRMPYGIVVFARALLERYGNASKNGAMAAGREGNDV